MHDIVPWTPAADWVFKRIMVNWLGNRKADYKERDFRQGVPASKDVVTLCGRCVFTNQLGNIMYGFMAQHFGLVGDARAYGYGKPPVYMKALGLKGPDKPWTARGEAYRETAFDIGVALGKRKELTAKVLEGLMKRHVQNPIDQGTSGFTPSTIKYTGAQTDLRSPSLVDPSGRRPKR